MQYLVGGTWSLPGKEAAKRVPHKCQIFQKAVRQATWNDILQESQAFDVQLPEDELKHLLAWSRTDAQSGLKTLRYDQEFCPDELRAFAITEIRVGWSSLPTEPAPPLQYRNRCSECGIASAIMPQVKTAWNVTKANRDSAFLFSADLLLVRESLVPVLEAHGVDMVARLADQGFVPVDAPTVKMDMTTLICSQEVCTACGRPRLIGKNAPGEKIPSGGVLLDGTRRLRISQTLPAGACWVSDVQIGYAEPHCQAYSRLLLQRGKLVEAIREVYKLDYIPHPVEGPSQ